MSLPLFLTHTDTYDVELIADFASQSLADDHVSLL